LPGGARGKDVVAGRRQRLIGHIRFAGGIIARKIGGKLGTTWGGGAKMKPDIRTTNSAAGDAEQESPENQKGNQALHFYRATMTYLSKCEENVNNKSYKY
jgi:hypothetical protein